MVGRDCLMARVHSQRRYALTTSTGELIAYVYAYSQADAQERGRKKLDRPGRREMLKVWVAGGKVTEKANDPEAMIARYEDYERSLGRKI